MNREIAVFDFDGTLRKGESSLGFCQTLFGKWRRILLLPLALLIPPYLAGIGDRKLLSGFTRIIFRRRPMNEVKNQGREYAETVLQRDLFPGVVERLRWHQRQGHRCILVSRGYDVILKPWARAMGFDEVCANELESVDGRCTGKLIGEDCTGEAKKRRVQQLLGGDDFTLYAYGDSSGDAELLAMAHFPFRCQRGKLIGLTPQRTALITGATSGIGLELARLFARHKYNLVLLGRNQHQLENLAMEWSKENGIIIVPMACDLSRADAAVHVFAQLQARHIEIDILVNNAGFGVWGEFEHTDLAKEEQMVQLHVNAMIELTKLALPSMLLKATGILLNVGSVYSFSPVPSQGVYAATKAFLLSFSQSLRQELKGKGVSVTLLCPGITRTGFRRSLGQPETASWMTMDPAEVALAAFAGALKGKFLVVPGMINKIYVFTSRHLPVDQIAAVIRWTLRAVRKFSP